MNSLPVSKKTTADGRQQRVPHEKISSAAAHTLQKQHHKKTSLDTQASIYIYRERTKLRSVYIFVNVVITSHTFGERAKMSKKKTDTAAAAGTTTATGKTSLDAEMRDKDQAENADVAEEEEEEEEEEEDEEEVESSDSGAGDTWINSFCSMVGHEYFAEVLDDFIDDDFNLTGLGQMVPNYREALELISDLEPTEEVKPPTIPLIEQSAELLYGLIHARFILSRPGLQIMAQKYECQHFGSCPRYYCDGTGLLPIGRYDLPGYETVRLYCPCCMDIYMPPNSRYLNIDGAYFGTTFAGLFLKTFPEIEQECNQRRQKQFELKIYGFKISELSKSGPRMKWLRQMPRSQQELDEVENDIAMREILERAEAEQQKQSEDEEMIQAEQQVPS